MEWKIKANITIFYLRVHDMAFHTHLFCNTRFIRSSGVRIFTATGRRRRPTLLSRMWSEAQLAVSNGHKHRPRRGRTAFTVVRFNVIRLLGYTDIPHNRKNPPPHNPTRHSPSSRTAYSVTAYRKFRSRWSLRMRLSRVRPLPGTGLALMRHTPEQRMNPNSRQNARRKATFQPVKRGLLPCKRRQTGNLLTISHLQTAQQDTPLTATNARKTPPVKQPDTPTCGQRQPAPRKQKNRWRHHDAIGLNSEYNLL